MANSWRSETTTFSHLRQSARKYITPGVVDWLKDIGLIPEDVVKGFRYTVKVALDPRNIPLGYLADCAFEWDSWGPSTPTEFLDAIEYELDGDRRRNHVAELLMLLGREEGTCALAA